MIGLKHNLAKKDFEKDLYPEVDWRVMVEASDGISLSNLGRRTSYSLWNQLFIGSWEITIGGA